MQSEYGSCGGGHDVTPVGDTETRHRLALISNEIERLNEAYSRTSETYEGLIDLPNAYDLGERQLEATIEILTLSQPSTDETGLAKRYAQAALLLIDKLNSSSLSIDQKDTIKDSERMAHIKQLFTEVIFLGGGPLFDSDMVLSGDAREIGGLLESAIAKHCQREDEFDVDPGDEEVIESERMILPRSQAVHLITHELIPALKRRLSNDPGDADIQRRIKALADTADAFNTLKYFPQARPPSFEKDAFTSALAGFTTNGEPLVTVEVPILKSTENRLDRLRDMIRTDIISGIAGKGLHKETDASLAHIQRAESGNQGSWGDAYAKLDTHELYRSLAMQYPFLKRIEDERELALLADLASRGEAKQLSSRIHLMIFQDRNVLMANREMGLIPPSTSQSSEPPSEHS